MRSDVPETTSPDKPLFPESRFAIDPSANPKHLDIVGIDSNGIYRVDGDTLTLAIADTGGPRPTEFESRFGCPVTLFVCRRTNELKSQAEGLVLPLGLRRRPTKVASVVVFKDDEVHASSCERENREVC